MKLNYLIVIIVAMMVSPSLFSQEEILVDFECDCLHDDESYNENVLLNHVRFHGGPTDILIPIEEDGYGLYPEIQYFSSSKYYPVAYVSGSHALVSAVFESTCSHPLWIRGTFDNGDLKFCFETKYIEPHATGDYYYPVTAADVPFESDEVDAFHDFEIYWEVSPDGIDFAHVGTSKNPLYVTYHEPLSDVVIHHSTISNSCNWAEGERGPQAIVDAVYELFESRCISIVSDKGRFFSPCLRYWGDEDLSLACSSTSDLFVSKNGRSENFAKLFKDMIEVQGIYHPVIKEITYKNGDNEELFDDLKSDLLSVFTKPGLKTNNNVLMDAAGIITVDPLSLFSPQLYINYDKDFRAAPVSLLNSKIEGTTMLYVKNFSQTKNNTFFLTDLDDDNSFSSKPNGVTLDKLSDSTGLAAQGNYNPPSRFSKLFLVDYFGKIYDPSYGVSSSDNIAKWEPKVLDGYGFRISDVSLRSTNSLPPLVINKDLDYIHKRETSGQKQTSVK